MPKRDSFIYLLIFLLVGLACALITHQSSGGNFDLPDSSYSMPFIPKE